MERPAWKEILIEFRREIHEDLVWLEDNQPRNFAGQKAHRRTLNVIQECISRIDSQVNGPQPKKPIHD